MVILKIFGLETELNVAKLFTAISYLRHYIRRRPYPSRRLSCLKMEEAQGTSCFLTKDFLLLCYADNSFLLSQSWTASYLDTHEEDDIIFQDEADFEKVTFIEISTFDHDKEHDKDVLNTH